MSALPEAGEGIQPPASNPLKKVLPRCGACHRYALAWPHKVALAAAAFAASLALLRLLGAL